MPLQRIPCRPHIYYHRCLNKKNTNPKCQRKCCLKTVLFYCSQRLFFFFWLRNYHYFAIFNFFHIWSNIIILYKVLIYEKHLSRFQTVLKRIIAWYTGRKAACVCYGRFTCFACSINISESCNALANGIVAFCIFIQTATLCFSAAYAS